MVSLKLGFEKDFRSIDLNSATASAGSPDGGNAQIDAKCCCFQSAWFASFEN